MMGIVFKSSMLFYQPAKFYHYGIHKTDFVGGHFDHKTTPQAKQVCQRPGKINKALIKPLSMMEKIPAQR